MKGGADLSFPEDSGTPVGVGEFSNLCALLHVATPTGELAEQELLSQAGTDPFGNADREISKHQPGTTIGSGIVKVREAG